MGTPFVFGLGRRGRNDSATLSCYKVLTKISCQECNESHRRLGQKNARSGGKQNYEVVVS